MESVKDRVTTHQSKKRAPKMDGASANFLFRPNSIECYMLLCRLTWGEYRRQRVNVAGIHPSADLGASSKYTS